MISYFGYALLLLFVLFATGMLNPILHRLFDDTEFTGLEKTAVLAWRERLTDRQKEILDQQLHILNLVQKGAGGAKVAAYYSGKSSIPRFENTAQWGQENGTHAATVEFSDLTSPDHTPLRVKIFLHEGRIFSVEYPKSPKRFVQKHGLDVDNLRVSKVTLHVSP